MTKSKRDLARLLRILAVSKSAADIDAECDERIRLTTSRGQFAFATQLVEDALRRGLISRVGDRLQIAADGAALAKRNEVKASDAFSAQHAELVPLTVLNEQDQLQTASVNANESPLARLFVRKTRNGRSYLTNTQFAAGERLRRDFEQARLVRRTTMRWENSVAGNSGSFRGADDLSDMALDARQRVERALRQLEQSLRGVVVDICCFLKGLEQVETERQWPPRSAKLMLRTALSILAAHYGYEARADNVTRPILHWGDGNHRPSIGG